jgi:hypothetical protein
MSLDKAGFGFHSLESLVALDNIGGGAPATFHLVQNDFRRLSVTCQLGDVVLKDTPCLPAGRKDRVPTAVD